MVDVKRENGMFVYKATHSNSSGGGGGSTNINKKKLNQTTTSGWCLFEMSQRVKALSLIVLSAALTRAIIVKCEI